MKVIPFTLKKANKFITEYHKHSKRVVGCRFCLAVEIDGKIEAVAIVGRPVARNLDDGLTAEVIRLCTRQNGIKNLCSILYSRCWKIWRLMGGNKLVTYTLETENGASLKASGFKKVSTTQLFKNGWTNRKNRIFPKTQLIKKVRWEFNTTSF